MGGESTINKDGMNAFEKIIKRLFDIIGAFVGLIVTSPLFLLVYILQKVVDGGPAFFRQERIGMGGKRFKIIKFRTMLLCAEDEGPQLAQKNDARLTCFGKFLRAHHLDELPQLINVLKGDMSFVGYRPEREYFIKQIMELRPDYQDLFLIRPGVTSYATLHNGYTSTMDKMITRLDMDLVYLRNRSLLGDIKIIFETLFSVVEGKHF